MKNFLEEEKRTFMEEFRRNKKNLEEIRTKKKKEEEIRRNKFSFFAEKNLGKFELNNKMRYQDDFPNF